MLARKSAKSALADGLRVCAPPPPRDIVSRSKPTCRTSCRLPSVLAAIENATGLGRAGGRHDSWVRLGRRGSEGVRARCWATASRTSGPFRLPPRALEHVRSSSIPSLLPASAFRGARWSRCRYPTASAGTALQVGIGNRMWRGITTWCVHWLRERMGRTRSARSTSVREDSQEPDGS